MDVYVHFMNCLVAEGFLLAQHDVMVMKLKRSLQMRVAVAHWPSDFCSVSRLALDRARLEVGS